MAAVAGTTSPAEYQLSLADKVDGVSFKEERDKSPRAEEAKESSAPCEECGDDSSGAASDVGGLNQQTEKIIILYPLIHSARKWFWHEDT